MRNIALAILCLFCLSGCSAKMAYNFMGFLTKWQISQYVTLNGEQRRLISETMTEFKAWHRQTQLLEYAQYIDEMSKRLVSEEITGAWIHAETDKVQIFLDTSLAQLKPFIIELMASLSDEQVEELMASFAKDREKFRKKRVEASERKKQKRRINELTDQTSRFFGKLTKEQRSWVDEWARAIKPYEALSLDQQKVWAKRIEDALQMRSDKKKLGALIDDIVFYRTDDWQPELQAILDYNQEISYTLLARIVNNLTPAQQEKMFSKLASYQQDFIDLSQKG